jgi:hypothetical protein
MVRRIRKVPLKPEAVQASSIRAGVNARRLGDNNIIATVDRRGAVRVMHSWASRSRSRDVHGGGRGWANASRESSQRPLPPGTAKQAINLTIVSLEVDPTAHTVVLVVDEKNQN